MHDHWRVITLLLLFSFLDTHLAIGCSAVSSLRRQAHKPVCMDSRRDRRHFPSLAGALKPSPEGSSCFFFSCTSFLTSALWFENPPHPQFLATWSKHYNLQCSIMCSFNSNLERMLCARHYCQAWGHTHERHGWKARTPRSFPRWGRVREHR